MRRILIALLIIAGVAAHARLEENITQCDQRYNVGGKNISRDVVENRNRLIRGPNTTNVIYRHDGWRIHVGYLNTVAVVIEYRRQDNDRIDDEQTQLLLHVNSGGGTWTPSSPGFFIRNDGATANRDVLGHAIRFESMQFKQHKERRRLQEEAARPKAGTRL